MCSNLTKSLKIMYIHYFAHANLYFCSHFLILVYVMYLICHYVSNFSFFVFQICFVRKLFYTWIKLQIIIVLTIKRLIVLYFASLHQIEYRFTLRTPQIESKINLKCVFFCSNLNNSIKNTNICEFALSNILHKSFDHMNIKVQHNDYASLFNGILITFLFTKVP